jgi:DNA end-binding protein Ku
LADPTIAGLVAARPPAGLPPCRPMPLRTGGIVSSPTSPGIEVEHEDTPLARAMWKGAIQFGLVTIPVKLYVATESRAGVSFNLLHATDLSRIQMKVYCPVDDAVINRSETVKGFEYRPGEYVVITDEDLESLPLKTVRSIEIEQFVEREAAATHTRFVKQAYYLEPDKIGRKAFALLTSVLRDKGLTAICKVVIKDREALAALDPYESTMVLSTLYWPDEIRALGELDLADDAPEIKAAEKAMAEQLIGAMTGDFDPAQYQDEYRAALMQIIESKVEGREIAAPPAAEETSNLVDLMAALQASVRAAQASRAAGTTPPVSVADAAARKAEASTDEPAAGTDEADAAGRAAQRRSA